MFLIVLRLCVCALGCGVPSIPPQVSGLKIVNGQNAVSGSWPWQVSLQDTSGFHFCGGSLISQNWVVTAAHCLILSEHDRQSNAEPIQVKSISRAITHPYYNSQNFNNNVTPLKLSSPVQITSRVSPVCLASSSTPFPSGTCCVTIGWGKTGTTSSPRILQQVALPLLSSAQCKQYWGQNRITEAMICAGASGGTTNCNVSTPVVYSRVTYLCGWIDQTVASN
uniref:Peptidase S1 domain-containing protein n=1 Tax=Oncorhynchus tshawytscha TaxID=74940 RepID=A0A8C8GR27_ONCTS